MVNWVLFKSVFIVFLVFAIVNLVSGFSFNGTVYDINGNPLNNSVVNVTIRDTNGFTIVGYNYTTTNASGWFNMSVDEDNSWMYEPKITFANETFNHVQFIGQSLPAFPVFVYNQLGSPTFYLRQAGSINITAINASGARIPFKFQIKDQRTGYVVAEELANNINVTLVSLPRDRNFSIMIYPDASMPVSFDWNNFSSSQSYNINTTNTVSNYNFTTRTLHYQFNTTLSMVRVSGFLDSSIPGWDEFTVVPFLVEPGNMVHSEFGDLPYNLSSATSGTDIYNLSNGYYNLSLPATAESSTILLFATAKNGSSYYGGFRNISLVHGSAAAETTAFNFTTVSGLMGTFSNISLDSLTGTTINVSTVKQTFNLVNNTNASLTQISAHFETTLDYSSFGAIEFTWMTDVGQAQTASISIPMLNNSGVKELNVFVGGGNFAPKKIIKSVSNLITDNNNNGNKTNVTIKGFNPQAIDSALDASAITMALYISNNTCDIPSPPAGCTVGSSSSMSDFNPLSAIIGGGKLSFRMGTGNISVHYVNVDMIASGPPDALFDDNNTDRGGANSFDQAVRFGSGGPTVYDYILVSIPYLETAGSGLNDSADVNITIPLFYDDDWNIIWNTTANGTDVSAFSANHSQYASQADSWSQLMNQTTCVNSSITDSSQINVSNPCYIDTTNNKVWIRLPHFSGNGPSVVGSVVAAGTTGGTTGSTTTGGSSGGGGGGSSTSTSKTKTKTSIWNKITPGGVTIMKINDKEIGLKEITISVNNPAQNVEIKVTKYEGKPAEVSVEKTGKVYKYLEISAKNLANNLQSGKVSSQVEKSWLSTNGLNKDNIALYKFDSNAEKWNELNTIHVGSDSSYEFYDSDVNSFSFFAVGEKTALAPIEEEETEGTAEDTGTSEFESEAESKKDKGNIGTLMLIILIVVIVLAGVGYYLWWKKTKMEKK